MSKGDQLEEIAEAIATIGPVSTEQVSESPEKEVIEENDSARKSYTWLYITGSIVIICSILAFLLYPKKRERNPYLPLPYVFDIKFRRALEKYISFPSHSEVLAITGPSGIGKTRGLLEFANSTDKIPIIFDFASLGRDAKYSHLFRHVVDAVNSSIYAQNATYRKEILSLQITNHLNILALIRHPLSRFYSFLDSLDHSCFMLIVFMPRYNFTYIQDAIDGFYTFCDTFSEGGRSLSLIVEFGEGYIPPNHAKALRVITVNDLTKESLLSEWVIKDPVFTQKQLNDLYPLFGGNGRYYADLYDLQREGKGLSDLQKLLKERVLSNAKSASLLKKGKVAIGKKNRKHVQKLIDAGIFTFDGEGKAVIRDKMMANAVKDALPILKKMH